MQELLYPYIYMSWYNWHWYLRGILPSLLGVCTQSIYIYTFLQNDARVEVKMAFKKRKREELKYPEGIQLETFCVHCKRGIMSLCQRSE